jgi:hypothetical protein
MMITYIYANRPEDQIRLQLRCRNLVEAFNRSGLARANLLTLEAFVQNTPEAQKLCAESDLLVIYRYLYGPVLTAIQYWKAREKKIIVDFDQAVNYLTPEMPDYSFWRQGSPLAGRNALEAPIDPLPLEQFRWGLGLVDAATAASARLADDWSQFARVYEIPDYLNTSQYPLLEKTHKDEIWVGLGPRTQPASFKNSGLAAALEEVCWQFPQVRLILCGWEKAPDLKIDPKQIRLQAPRCFDDWVKILLNLDLGLAPVAGDYDLRLSQVNLFEFMLAKIPWVATEQGACQPLLSGRWVQNSPENWESAVLETVEHLAVYQRKAAGEPFLFALGQDLSVNLEKVLKVYSAIVAG